MRAVRAWRAAGLALLAAGCATTPVPQPEPTEPAAPSQSEVPQKPEPAPMIESPPIEPVEPPVSAQPAPRGAPEPAPPSATISPPAPPPTPPVTTPPPPAPPSVPAAPPEPPEDAQVVALIADLSRYSTLGSDDLRRELAAVNAAFTRQRTDANRVRLAVLYTLARAPQDDQRALQLLDNVTKSGGPATPVKNLALVLQAQLSERQRALRDEQQKGEQAVRKLDQLLEMERTLLRDRVRSGGGGGGGGAGGSAGH